MEEIDMQSGINRRDTIKCSSGNDIGEIKGLSIVRNHDRFFPDVPHRFRKRCRLLLHPPYKILSNRQFLVMKFSETEKDNRPGKKAKCFQVNKQEFISSIKAC